MNIIPPAGYARTVFPTRTPPKRISATTSNKHDHQQGERRHHEERRRHLSSRKNTEFSMEMRQSGDRRRSNRLFVTT